jgi:hypothetical protein
MLSPMGTGLYRRCHRRFRRFRFKQAGTMQAGLIQAVSCFVVVVVILIEPGSYQSWGKEKDELRGELHFGDKGVR